MVKKKVVSWSVLVQFENGKTKELADMPSDVSQAVDDWLTEEGY